MPLALSHRLKPRCLAILGLVFAVLPALVAAANLACYLPPPGATYFAEEVRVRSPGRQSLAGTLTVPTRGVLREGRPLRYPAILLLSGAAGLTRDGTTIEDAAGSTPSYRPLFDLADTLTRRDVAVLRLDDRGVGASTGALDFTTVVDRCDDARAALAYLRRRADIDPHRIAIAGMGEGAAIAALIAATDPDLRGIVLVASPATLARPAATSALVISGDAQAIAAPAAAAMLMQSVRGKVADWVAATLGGAELGPRPAVAVRRRRHR